MIPLIDSDSIIYRSCYAFKDSFLQSIEYADFIMDRIESRFGVRGQAFLGGNSNFRYSVFPEYKSARKDKPKPQFYNEVREYFITTYSPTIIDGYEAEDVVGSMATNQHVICGIDKDLDTIPGHHYNYVKDLEYYVTEEQASYNFFYQLLLGDSTDGIPGIKGIGKVKATKLLTGVDVVDYKTTVQNKYLEVYEDKGLEEFDKNARLVFIKRGSLDSEYYHFY